MKTENAQTLWVYILSLTVSFREMLSENGHVIKLLTTLKCVFGDRACSSAEILRGLYSLNGVTASSQLNARFHGSVFITAVSFSLGLVFTFTFFRAFLQLFK